jgi:hypothetical protein
MMWSSMNRLLAGESTALHIMSSQNRSGDGGDDPGQRARDSVPEEAAVGEPRWIQAVGTGVVGRSRLRVHPGLVTEGERLSRNAHRNTRPRRIRVIAATYGSIAARDSSVPGIAVVPVVAVVDACVARRP